MPRSSTFPAAALVAALTVLCTLAAAAAQNATCPDTIQVAANLPEACGSPVDCSACLCAAAQPPFNASNWTIDEKLFEDTILGCQLTKLLATAFFDPATLSSISSVFGTDGACRPVASSICLASNDTTPITSPSSTSNATNATSSPGATPPAPNSTSSPAATASPSPSSTTSPAAASPASPPSQVPRGANSTNSTPSGSKLSCTASGQLLSGLLLAVALACMMMSG